MTPISVTCPNCRNVVTVNQQAGSISPCPCCQSHFRIPTAAAIDHFIETRQDWIAFIKGLRLISTVILLGAIFTVTSFYLLLCFSEALARFASQLLLYLFLPVFFLECLLVLTGLARCHRLPSSYNVRNLTFLAILGTVIFTVI